MVKKVQKKIVKKKKTSSTTKNKNFKKEIKILKEELDNYKDKNIRLLAEFDNYKRRNIAKQNDLIKYDGLDFVKSILPVLDDLERILDLKELKDNKALFNGFKMITKKINKKLNDFGIVKYASIGQEFSPDYHEALMMKKVDKKTNIIIEEFEKGYKYHDKVIRHAKVVVGE